ncbi:hypothetical protein C7B80_11950 [Cyanosarcina cf. burmensis CCALA 770]|nr:hypothetical protein C7B80_11950 [Cyanosarcina cf. burmensis CCALA 770]
MDLSTTDNPFLVSQELLDSAELLTRARDLVRASKQQIDISPYIAALETALQPYTDSEFYDWCADVDRALSQKLNDDGTPQDLSLLEWDCQQLYDANLTVIQATDKLYQLVTGTRQRSSC